MHYGDERLPQRFWGKVRPSMYGNCWLWVGQVSVNGYGRIRLGDRVDGRRRQVTAHRAAYEALVGPIPAGLQSDHLCRNRRCVNPDHVEPVTGSENQRRSHAAVPRDPFVAQRLRARTHCSKGHLYDEANTGSYSDGSRRCRACSREWCACKRRAENQSTKRCGLCGGDGHNRRACRVAGEVSP